MHPPGSPPVFNFMIEDNLPKKMHGPTLDGYGTLVNRLVPACDVHAYKEAGYEFGYKDGLQTAEEYGVAKEVAKAKPAKVK